MTPEKVELGRRLFFDPRLSEDGTVSCSTCHQPDHFFASPDPIARGIGGRKGRRNAPSLFNRAYGNSLFWDGRSASLEEQALQPLENPDEMGTDIERTLVWLRQQPDYQQQFEAAFGLSDDPDEPVIRAETVAKSLAAYERTLLLGDSAVDRFRNGDYSALSAEARSGMWLFESRGRCWKCHGGENFSDEAFHNTGVGFGMDDRDPGRFAVSNRPEDRFRYKTPSLRGVAFTAPYMHDGSIQSLQDVVEFYSRGGSPDDPGIDPEMKRLDLSPAEIRQLVAFLEALSSPPDPNAAAPSKLPAAAADSLLRD